MIWERDIQSIVSLAFWSRASSPADDIVVVIAEQEYDVDRSVQVMNATNSTRRACSQLLSTQTITSLPIPCERVNERNARKESMVGTLIHR
jgi:hypothetical protein